MNAGFRTRPPETHDNIRPRPRAAGGVLVTAFLAGFFTVLAAVPAPNLGMLPWIVGRGLGIAAYLDLTALVLLGSWFSHPWRLRRPILHPSTVLRAHSVLAAGVAFLVLGHVLALVADRYAGVGWRGALLPGAASYRPGAVALGIAALYFGLAAGGTAALAGRLLARHRWLTVHRAAYVAFALVWFHGVLAGSDTPALRVVYTSTGLAVLALAITRWSAPTPAVRSIRPEPATVAVGEAETSHP